MSSWAVICVQVDKRAPPVANGRSLIFASVKGGEIVETKKKKSTVGGGAGRYLGVHEITSCKLADDWVCRGRLEVGHWSSIQPRHQHSCRRGFIPPQSSAPVCFDFARQLHSLSLSLSCSPLLQHSVEFKKWKGILSVVCRGNPCQSAQRKV